MLNRDFIVTILQEIIYIYNNLNSINSQGKSFFDTYEEKNESEIVRKLGKNSLLLIRYNDDFSFSPWKIFFCQIELID